MRSMGLYSIGCIKKVCHLWIKIKPLKCDGNYFIIFYFCLMEIQEVNYSWRRMIWFECKTWSHKHHNFLFFKSPKPSAVYFFKCACGQTCGQCVYFVQLCEMNKNGQHVNFSPTQKAAVGPYICKQRNYSNYSVQVCCCRVIRRRSEDVQLKQKHRSQKNSLNRLLVSVLWVLIPRSGRV